MRHHGPDMTTLDPRPTLLRTLEREGFEGSVAVAIYRHIDAELMKSAGAAIVLEPFEDAADTTLKRVLGSLSGKDG